MDRLTIVTVVGARPQFVKAAAVSRAIKAFNAAENGGSVRIEEVLVHTGQHYDHAMSQSFFDELGIDEPDVNLGVGSGSHASQTARMLEGIESILTSRPHHALLVYGDTNSTLAGALAASKLHTPVFHVEAGLRSFNQRMPEEINRVLTDHVSSLLFCPTTLAVDNLARESVTRGVHLVGDVMFDSVLHYRAKSRGETGAARALNVRPGEYLLATVHRAENTDDRERLAAILSGLGEMGATTPVVLALHPRTRKAIDGHGLTMPDTIRVTDPLPYLSMLRLQADALGVVTDSGGMQKEAFFLGRPCLTIRDETEWMETVDLGANTLAGADREAMLDWFGRLHRGEIAMPEEARPYGDGNASARIVRTIIEHLTARTCPGE